MMRAQRSLVLPHTTSSVPGDYDPKPSPAIRVGWDSRTLTGLLVVLVLLLSLTCAELFRELQGSRATVAQALQDHLVVSDLPKILETKKGVAAIPPLCPPCPLLPTPVAPLSSSASSSASSLAALEKENASLKKAVDKIPRMKEDLQRLSRDYLSLAYPNYESIFVHLYVAFSHNDPPDLEPRLIKIQLATSEMPYTVAYFVQQVLAGIWSGFGHFHRNADHVLQADPFQANDSPNVPGRRQVFKDLGLYSVAFQEYNPQYPHVKYTIGLAGRPGGPDVYISTIDNTINHGPGGQVSYAVQQEADPCFGKVVEGFDVVDRMHRQDKVPGDGYEKMINFVDVVKVEIHPSFRRG